MTQHDDRPSWVIEQLLDWRQFDCCSDQDPFPFQCCQCLEPLVFCCECDMLYADLRNLAARSRAYAETICPRCSTVFGDDLLTSPGYRVSFDRWHACGLDHLLIERPISELAEMLVAAAGQIEQWLSRGMRSTARTRLLGFRNLAESIEVHLRDANRLREGGSERVHRSTLAEALDWQRLIPDQVDRAYAMLGIAEAAVYE
jgi:hypothetical protein